MSYRGVVEDLVDDRAEEKSVSLITWQRLVRYVANLLMHM
jgi:hypothetical protein